MPLAGCHPLAYPHAPADLKLLTPKRWSVLDAAARRLVPGTPALPGAGELGVASAVDRFFAPLHPRMQADLGRLLDTIEDMPWLSLRRGKFTAMGSADQDAYLADWQRSWLGPKRRAFVAVMKLVETQFYMDPRSWEAIGFPGPWVGRVDVGLGLDNQGALAANPNPNVFAKHKAAV